MKNSCISNNDSNLISLLNETGFSKDSIKPIINLWRGSIPERQELYPSLDYVEQSMQTIQELTKSNKEVIRTGSMVLNQMYSTGTDIDYYILLLRGILNRNQIREKSTLGDLRYTANSNKEFHVNRLMLGLDDRNYGKLKQLLELIPETLLLQLNSAPSVLSSFQRFSLVDINSNDPTTWDNETLDIVEDLYFTKGQIDEIKTTENYDQLTYLVRDQLNIVYELSRLNDKYPAGTIGIDVSNSQLLFILTHEFGHFLEKTLSDHPQYGFELERLSKFIQNILKGKYDQSESLKLLVERYNQRLNVYGYNNNDIEEISLDLFGLLFLNLNNVEESDKSIPLAVRELFVNHDQELMLIFNKGLKRQGEVGGESFLERFKLTITSLANSVMLKFGKTYNDKSFLNFVGYNSLMAIQDPSYIYTLRNTILNMLNPGQFNGKRTDLELTEAHEHAKLGGHFDPVNHVYTKDGLIYTSVTTLMKEKGVKVYDGKITDEKRLKFEGANLGRDFGTLVLLEALKILGFEAQDDPTIPMLSISDDLIRHFRDHLNRNVIGPDGKTITLESMMFSNEGPLRLGSIDLRFARNDKKGLTITLDIKTRIVKVKYPDGTERTNQGFQNYGRIGTFGESDKFGHAVQLFSYKELERQNGLLRTDGKESLDAYGTILYDLEVQVNEDGTKVLTDIKPSEVSKDEGIQGFVRLVENSEVRALVDKTMRGTLNEELNSTRKIQNQISKIYNDINVLLETLRAKGSKALLNRLGDISKSIQRLVSSTDYTQSYILPIKDLADNVGNLQEMIGNLSSTLVYDPNNVVQSLKFLNTLILQLQLFDGMNDLVSLLNQLRLENDKTALNILRNTNIELAANNIEQLYYKLIQDRKKLLAMWVLNLDQSVQDQFKKDTIKDLTKSWIKLNPGKSIRQNQELFDKYLENYINEVTNREGQRITETLINKFLELFESVDYDINYAQAWLGAVQDNPDPIISLIGREYNKVLDNIRNSEEDFLTELTDLQDEVYKFKKASRFANPRNVYEDLIDDSDPNNLRLIESPEISFQRLLSEYKKDLDYDSFIKKSEFWDLVDEWILKNSTFDLDLIQAVRYRLNDEYKQLLDQGLITEHDYNVLRYVPDSKDQSVLLENKNDNRTAFSLLARRKISQSALDLFGDLRDKSLNSLRRSNNIDPKYTELMKRDESDPIRKLYTFITETVSQFDTIVPSGARLGSRLPGVNKFSYQLLMDGDFPTFIKLRARKISPIKLDINLESLQNRQLQSQRLVNELGYVLGVVPVYYTQSVPLNLQSFDLLKIYGMWYKSANLYVQKQLLLPMIEATEQIVSSRNVLATDGKTGLPILRKGVKKTTKNVVHQTLIKSTKNNTLEQYKLWINNVVYEMDYGSSNEMSEAIVKTMQTFNLKLRLGWNLLLWTVNIMMGETQNILKMAGGKHISAANFGKLHALYMKDIFKYIKDLGNYKKTSKINLVNRYLGVFEEHYSGGKLETGVQAILQEDVLFSGQTLGEHYIQSRMSVLYLLQTKVTDLQGNVIGNLYDNLDAKNNRVRVNPRVKGIIVNGQLYTNIKEGEISVMSNIDYLLRSMHGNYKPETKVMIESLVWTKLFYAFRRWIFSTSYQFYNGWYNGLQFSNYTRDTRIGSITSGIIGSKGLYEERKIKASNRAAKEAGESTQTTNLDSLWRVLQVFMLTMLSKFGVKVNTDYLTKLQNDLSSQRMIDNNSPELREFLALISILLLTNALLMIAGGQIDKKRRNKLKISNSDWFWYYILNRYKTELMFYASPLEIFEIIQTPIPASGLFDDFGKVWDILLSPANWGDTVRSGPNKGKNVALQRIGKLVPGYSQLKSLQSMENKIKNFQK